MKPSEQQEATLKLCIKNTEARYIEYKKALEDSYKDRVNFPPNDELTNWYKELLKDNKKTEEALLKGLKDEMTHFNQGVNPPFYYPEYWKLKEKQNIEHGIKTHTN